MPVLIHTNYAAPQYPEIRYPPTRPEHSRRGSLSEGPAEADGYDLDEEGVGPGGVSRLSFVADALRELSAGLRRGGLVAHRASLGVLARSSGSGIRPGLSLSTNGTAE
jgi:hypothetical protein